MADILETISAEELAGLRRSNGTAEQEIRERAYQIFEQRGGQEGHAEEDWYQAESELLSERSTTVAA